jgi:micrococcal nuclease
VAKRKKNPRYAMRRTTRNAIGAAFFFIAVPAFILLDRQFGDILRKPIERATYTNTDRQTYHGRTFSVLEVIDGDTLDIDSPDGEFPDTRIRLLGVDTPETKHPTIGVMYFGPEASDFSTQTALGQKVTILLDTVGDQRDRYGRLLAYVVLPDGRVLNEELIRHGFGYAYLSFPHSDSARYEALMDHAIQSKTGLWSGAARDDLPKWLRQKRPGLLRNP